MTPTAVVIASTQFFGVPAGLQQRGILAGQDRGADGARLVECAGRCCYDSYGAGRESGAYHAHLREVRHGSVLEHVTLSFYLSEISRSCTHELVRHRHAAISQRSTRYVDESENEWCWHPAMERLDRDSPERMGGLDCFIVEARDLYMTLVERLEPLVGRKQARGAARGALGGALSTALVWTVNLRTLRHFLELRATVHADGEIRLLANAIYEAALPHCPEWLGDYEKVEMVDGMGFGLTTQYPGL